MASLELKGYELTPFGQSADITIINTCTVTHRADFQSRQTVRRALKASPGSLVIVTGCYPQVDPGALARIEGVSYVLGNEEKAKIPDLLPRMEKGELPETLVGDIQEEEVFSDLFPQTFHRHTRALLKIQDGCNARCSYCIVPYARGRSRSLPPEKVIERLDALERRGFKEVVLTGIHIGSYGLDLSPRSSLLDLLRHVEESPTPPRIRLSSIEPLDFSGDLIDLLATSRNICPHLHIPIQSGDDEVLERMHRSYTRDFLHDLVHELHRRIAQVCIGADIMVGFPGETEEAFRRTYGLIEALPVSYLHVFPFSSRKGTLASTLSQTVSEGSKKIRADQMRRLGKEKRQAFYRRFLRQRLDVLVEDQRDKKTARWKGFSRNYIPVQIVDDGHLKDPSDWINQELPVLVTELLDSAVLGRRGERRDG